MEIVELSAHINAAKARLLERIAEFDEGGGRRYQGCASCTHWLSWKCGVSPAAAREQARIRRLSGEVTSPPAIPRA